MPCDCKPSQRSLRLTRINTQKALTAAKAGKVKKASPKKATAKKAPAKKAKPCRCH
jgi:hypothetical protein